MARIDFPDGRWVELRPMYVDEELALDDFDRAGDELEQVLAQAREATAAASTAAAGDREAALDAAAVSVTEVQRRLADRLREARRIVSDACTGTSWGGPLTARLTKAELRDVMVQWRLATEDDAVPPVSGTSS